MSRLAPGVPFGGRPDFLNSPLRQVLVGLGILALMALWLRLVGRPLICPCGSVVLFVGDPASPQNSQQIADWYSGLHIVFGFGLWVALDRLRPHWRTSEKLLVALASSAIWEAIENVPLVIGLFGNAPGSPVYAGDSILNALADSAFVALGFFIARPLPLAAIVALAVVIEIAVSIAIDDGLVLGLLRMVGLPV